MGILPSGITSAFGQQTAATQARMTRLGRATGLIPGMSRKTRKKLKTAKKKLARVPGLLKGKRKAKMPKVRPMSGTAAAQAWSRKMARAKKKKAAAQGKTRKVRTGRKKLSKNLTSIRALKKSMG